MATKAHKKVTRETLGDYVYRGDNSRRPLLVSINREVLEFRPKGCRKTYTLPISTAYMLAVKIEADATTKARRSLVLAKRRGQPKPKRYTALRNR